MKKLSPQQKAWVTMRSAKWKKAHPKSKQKKVNTKNKTMVDAGIAAGRKKRKSEGLSNPKDKKEYYDVMQVYSKRKKFLKPTCVCCLNTDWKFLAFDHTTKRPKSHKGIGGVTLARRLKKDGYPSGIQILCHNCNTGKEIFGGVRCPHHLSNEAQKKLKRVKLPLGKILKK